MITKPQLLSVFPSFRIGGAQVRFAAVANYLGPGLRHSVVSMDGAFDCKSKLSAGLDVEIIPVENRKQSPLDNRRRFREILRLAVPDVLVTHNWGCIDWALANWPKLVRHVHIEDGFGPDEADRQLRRRMWTRRILLRNSTVVVPSRLLERLAIDVWRLNPPSVRYVPNGIDVARFADREVEPVFPRSATPIIGTVAALRREKNLPRLLDAFRMVRDRTACKLIIGGDGPERPGLEARARALGLAADVVFTGYRADTERVYAAMDIFALSSDTEQMPTTVLEAMAAGLPIASTDVGDVRAMVAIQNRHFIVPKSADALATGLLELIRSAELRGQLGAANQAAVEHNYTQEKMFESYEALLLQRNLQTSA